MGLLFPSKIEPRKDQKDLSNMTTYEIGVLALCLLFLTEAVAFAYISREEPKKSKRRRS
jgi:hypothetical protein